MARAPRNIPAGVIHITGKLVVPADTGCHLWPNCTTCPMPKCYLDMTIGEKQRMTRALNRGVKPCQVRS